MHDAADKATEDEARAWELFAAERKDREARDEAARRRFPPQIAAYCLECGSEIPPLRLQAVPSTHHCVRCAERIQGR